MTAVNFSALTQPVSNSEVATYRTRARAAGTPKYSTVSAWIAATLGTVFFFMFASIPMNIFVTRTLEDAARGDASPAAIAGAVIASLVLLALIGGWVVLLYVLFTGGNTWQIWYRLDTFARNNNLLFSASSPAPSYPGMIFRQTSSGKALNHVRATSGRYFDLGNFQYVTGSGKSRQTHNWGFLALKLDRALPHMLLDAKSNNSFLGSNLPQQFRKDQQLSLEGDFDRYFTLYCPREYERDALYVFTPDLMALLIDEASPFDVEIIDQWMFVYAARPFSPLKPGDYERMFRVIDTVGKKTLSQTERYSDERIGLFSANIVAPQGQRLRTRVPVIALIVVVGVIAFNVMRTFL